GKRTNRGASIQLERRGKSSSLSALSLPAMKTNELGSDDGSDDEAPASPSSARSDDAIRSSSPSTPLSSPGKFYGIKASADSDDGADASVPTLLAGGEITEKRI